MNKSARILVVDDDKSICEMLKFALEEEGYVVDKAENGREAIAKTNASLYNLAIVDWRLPDIEGTKLLGQFKETTPKMAKIMLTGYPSMRNAIDAVNERVDAFLLKPIDFEVLLKKVKELLKQQGEDRAFSEEKMVAFIETRAKEIMQSKTTNK